MGIDSSCMHLAARLKALVWRDGQFRRAALRRSRPGIDRRRHGVRRALVLPLPCQAVRWQTLRIHRGWPSRGGWCAPGPSVLGSIRPQGSWQGVSKCVRKRKAALGLIGFLAQVQIVVKLSFPQASMAGVACVGLVRSSRALRPETSSLAPLGAPSTGDHMGIR